MNNLQKIKVLRSSVLVLAIASFMTCGSQRKDNRMQNFPAVNVPEKSDNVLAKDDSDVSFNNLPEIPIHQKVDIDEALLVDLIISK